MTEKFAQRGDFHTLARLRHEVRDERVRSASLRVNHDGRMADLRMLLERRFDFAGFDAEAAQLHLLIGPPEVFDRAVRQPAGAIAGAVEPSVRGLEKSFRRQFRGSVVAERDAGPPR